MQICREETDPALKASGDEELIGILTAISVVSRQLAGKLSKLSQQEQRKVKGGKKHGNNGRTCRCRF